jgi:hypothetical protein
MNNNNNHCLKHSKSSIKNDDDLIYYDISATNYTTATSNIRLNFQETRSSPFLQKPSDFNLSIVRFSLDTYNLPVFIPTIKYESSDADETIYSLTVKYKDKYYIKNIKWKSQNLDVSKPSKTVNNFQDYNSTYYYCYTFNYFVNLLNDEIIKLFEEIADDNTTENFDTEPFYFKFLSDFTFSIVLNNDMEDLEIYFNNGLYSLFSSFTFIRSSDDVYKLIYKNYEKTEVFEIVQDYSAIDIWTPISSLVFTSSSLPIVPSQISKPNIFYNNQLISNSNNSNDLNKIITDLEVNQQNYKPNLLYNPTAEYRYIEMLGDTPLNYIDINVMIKLKDGQLVPFYLSSFGSMTLKILFKKKDNYLLNYQ